MVGLLKGLKPWKQFAAVFFALFFSYSGASAQQTEYFPFYSRDTLASFKLASAHRASFKTALPAPTAVSSDYKNQYKKIVNHGADHVYNAIRYGSLADTLLAPYIRKVYDRIVKANKNLPPTSIFLTRNPSENAYATLDGTLFFNVGLLAKLENESQLAFIISHELSHAYFKHTQNGLHKELASIYNKDFQKEYKKIVREEYNKNSKLEALVRNVSLNNLYHDRKDEKQADSLAYVLLSNSGYDATQAYTALQLLDKIDEPYTKENFDLQKFFTCPAFQYSFTGKPAKKQSIFNIQADTSIFQKSDTLKTHPDCAKRMRYISDLAKMKPAPAPKFQEDEARFSQIRAVSRREVLQSLFDLEYYDYSLFNSLVFLKDDPESSYFKAMVGLSLYKLKENLEDHTYSDVVSKISNNQPENFSQFLGVLHNLKVTDFKGFAGCFNEAFQIKPETNEYNLAARYTFLALKDTVLEAEELKQQYFKTYKGGRFEKKLFAENTAPKKKK